MATYTTGGNLPPDLMTVTSGSNLPPIPAPTSVPPISGNLPPTPVGTTINGQDYVATVAPGGQPGSNFSPANVVGGLNNQFAKPNLPGATTTTLDSLGQILDSGSPYMQNARRRGLELAGSRGLLNSSIAAGSSQRAAIESAMPILNQAMGLNNQREGQDFQALTQSRNQAFDLTKTRENQAFTAQENLLDRTQQVNNQLLGAKLRKGEILEQGQVQNWLNNESFTRQFNGQLKMLPIHTAADLTTAITQFAMQDPELYTPTVVSGMTEFFTKNMQAILAQFFPTTGGGT